MESKRKKKKKNDPNRAPVPTTRSTRLTSEGLRRSQSPPRPSAHHRSETAEGQRSESGDDFTTFSKNIAPATSRRPPKRERRGKGEPPPPPEARPPPPHTHTPTVPAPRRRFGISTPAPAAPSTPACPGTGGNERPAPTSPLRPCSPPRCEGS